ncbi:MAG: SpaA isopeptide-forming pilin-related protein, partial [Peptoniphilus harei]|nr:SpaA isopeptide-forming pilin-related protein [Peptoniphilus harei]
ELKYWRNQLTLSQNNYQSPFAVVVEFEYQKPGAIGLGANYRPNRSDAGKEYWAAESYDNGPAGINKNQPVITYEYGSEKTTIPMEDYSNDPTKYVKDPNMNVGQEKIVNGQDGQKETFYKYEVKNGVRTGVKEVDTSKGTNGVTIIKEMIPKQRYIGTKQVTPDTYTVSVNSTKLTATPNLNVAPNTQVKVDVTLGENEELDSLYYNDGTKNVPIDKNTKTFTMPAANVTVNATFKTKKTTGFSVTTSVNDPNLGSVTVNPSKAKAGDPVTVTVTPKDSTVEVTDVKLDNISIGPKLVDGKYTFPMPANNVTVSVTFNKKAYTTYPVGIEGNNERGWITITQISDNHNREAREGEVVKFRVDAKPGWEVIKDQVFVRKANGEKIIPDFDGVNGSFKMPAGGVTIVASSYKEETVPDGSFVATVDPTITGGNISVSQRINKPGEKVRITLTPWEGFKNTAQSVRYAQGGTSVPVLSDEQGYYFIMPASKVTVSGTFVRDTNPGAYTVNIGQTQNGRVSASPTSANQGDEITLSAVANPGYVFKGYTVTDASGQAVQLKGNKFTMPAGAVNVSATFEYAGIEIPKDKFAQITNKQVGLEFKIYKHDFRNRPLEGAAFELYNADKNYNITDKDGEGKEKASMSGISDKDGIVKFFKGGNEVKLTPGYYVLREVTSPQGYKKISADWKIRVYEDSTGAMKAEYKGPENTPTNFVTSDKAKDANTANGTTYLKKAGSGIKYASKMTYINTESKTFIQRIYIDTRNYTGNEKVNVQITPVIKREEFDRPGQHPQIGYDGKYGVKTAYRSTYQIAGLDGDPDNTKLNDILSIYNLSDPNVSMINTARWRPFDWGF